MAKSYVMKMLAGYPQGTEQKAGYYETLTSALEGQPVDVLEKLIRSLPSKTKWLPTVADIAHELSEIRKPEYEEERRERLSRLPDEPKGFERDDYDPEWLEKRANVGGDFSWAFHPKAELRRRGSHIPARQTVTKKLQRSNIAGFVEAVKRQMEARDEEFRASGARGNDPS